MRGTKHGRAVQSMRRSSSCDEVSPFEGMQCPRPDRARAEKRQTLVPCRGACLLTDDTGWPCHRVCDRIKNHEGRCLCADHHLRPGPTNQPWGCFPRGGSGTAAFSGDTGQREERRCSTSAARTLPAPACTGLLASPARVAVTHLGTTDQFRRHQLVNIGDSAKAMVRMYCCHAD